MPENVQSRTDTFFKTDKNFNEVYPGPIQKLAERHWTPLHIARLATEFLATKTNCKILDIGSGVGKFCLAGAHYAPNADFYGIEQREYLIAHAHRAQDILEIPNVTFIRGNFTQLKFREFDHFYFFNSFYENLDPFDRIDDKLEYSASLYEYYIHFLYNRLRWMPSGTKIATYHALNGGMPQDYELIQSLENDDLKFWMKK